MKRILILFLCFFILLGISGCSSSKKNESSEVDNNIDETSSSENTSEEIICTSIESKYKNYWSIEGEHNTFNLEIKILPDNCTQTVQYKIDDETIGRIDKDGNLSPGKVGKTNIIISCGDQSITVGYETKAKTVKLDKIELEDIVVKCNEKASIVAKFYPENTTEKELKYESFDSSLVSVNEEGEIVGLQPGPCEIYVEAANGEVYTCNVLVEGTFLDIDLPLFSELSYKDGNYVNCNIFLHTYEDGTESIDNVYHEADLHCEGGEVELVGDMLLAHSDPGEFVETTVWFTYKEYTSNKVTIYVKP